MTGSLTRKLTLATLSLLSLSALPAKNLLAQTPAAETHSRTDLTGTWQGTLETNRSLRIVMQISKADKGWDAKVYSIDQNGQAIKASSVSLDGSAFKCSLDAIGLTYQGTLSPDGNSIVGTWAQGPDPKPLTFVRATKETAWEIPAPPAPIKMMAADADPSFDVATIKPNDSGGNSMQQLTLNGRSFVIRNGSLGDMIAFAFNVHAKQIVNAPDWLDKDRYDISGTPDKEGAPTDKQLRVMMQKLLADRFALKFHHDKRDLSAYVLSVSKTGSKLTPTQFNGPLPGFGLRPAPTGTSGMTVPVRNASMPDFTSFLQMMVLDRPVVDQTNLTGKYDFQLVFTPDDSLFNGHPPKMPPTNDTAAEPAPGFFQAFQQQLGLKLDAEKTPVDVIAIDHVDKPSAN